MLWFMRRTAPIFILLAIGLIALWSIGLAAGLAAIAGISLFVRQSIRTHSPSRGPADAERTRRARLVGRRELGDDRQDAGPIVVDTTFGAAIADITWQEGVPVVEISYPLGEPADMTFVIRRRQSTIGLQPVVENTPVTGAVGEIRLRRMPLGEPLDAYFEAGSSRPRLFRELLDLGLREALTDLADQPRFRLEDCSFSGDRLTLLLQPAGDPTVDAWLQESVDVCGYLALGLHRFIVGSVSPSAYD
jgi:hypothetical protein